MKSRLGYLLVRMKRYMSNEKIASLFYDGRSVQPLMS